MHDQVVSPLALLDVERRSRVQINAQYYIRKQLLPVLNRVGACACCECS